MIPAGNIEVIYITDPVACTVSVVETSTNKRMATLFVAGFPQRVAIPPVKARALIIGGDENYNGFVLLVDTKTYEVTAEKVLVGQKPEGVAFATVHHNVYAYVANSRSNTVSVIQLTTGREISTPIPPPFTIRVGGQPIEVAVANKEFSKYVYVTCYEKNLVSIIDTGKNQVVRTVPVGAGPLGIALNPSETRAYVANYDGRSVSVIQIDRESTKNGKVLHELKVNQSPEEVIWTLLHDGRAPQEQVYVINQESDDPCNVSVISGFPHKVSKEFRVGRQLGGIAFTRAESAYVSVSDGSHSHISLIHSQHEREEKIRKRQIPPTYAKYPYHEKIPLNQ
jgi:YVTN family beta-propeller protein